MISVVIPLYNKAQSITHTLDSVLAQTYTDYEVVVVNDGSTDGSGQVVEDYIKSQKALATNPQSPIINQKSPITNHQLQIRLIDKPNGGVCSARNRGIREAKGEYVALLDADDLWDKDYLAEQVRMIKDFPKAFLWGMNYAELDKEKHVVRRIPTGLLDGYRGYVENYFEIPGRVSELLCSSSVVIRKEAFEIVGYFDERIKYSEDSEMWWRLIVNFPFAFYDKYLAFYLLGAENRASHQKIQLKFDAPFYIDKYVDSKYKQHKVFYQWVNRYCAIWIARYYFGDKTQRADAKVASKKIDYSVLPWKYSLYFKTPFIIGYMVYTINKWLKKNIK